MRLFLAAAMLCLASLAAVAHEKPVKGPNGGQLIHLDDAHYELVAKDNELTLFVADNDTKPRATLEGARATATVLVDDKTTSVTLAPAAADTLRGPGTFVAKTGLRVVVSIQEAGRKPAQVRFTPAD